MQNIPHIPVLHAEVVDIFKDIQDGIVVDCTMGYGGHSSLILQSNPNIKIIGIDQDDEAIEFSKKRLEQFGDRVSIKKGRFSNIIKEILSQNQCKQIKGILADIGVSSLQLDKKERGFSYESENLDMRMDKTSSLKASDVINSYSQNELERIFKEYGEIKNYKQLASKIIQNRPFYSAKELVETLSPYLKNNKKIHPATLLFQAIRIEVNDELGELKRLLEAIKDSQLEQAKIGIISFHSLEDRIVKQTFAFWAKSCICPKEAIRCECGNNHAFGKILTKKPIIAKEDEIKQNPRSRSAKLRVFEIWKR